jgi:hypothetical protein
MKSIYKFLYVLLIPLAIVLYASSSGSPGGKSGSPGDNGTTCTECHAGTATSIAGWVTSTIPAQGYTPGETYTMTVNGTLAGAGKYGFELTAETATGSKTGTFIISDATRTRLTNGGNAVTHTSSGNSGGASTSWTVSWTAPATDVGQVRFYVAVNAANGNGNNSGDMIFTSTLFVDAAAPAALVSVNPTFAEKGSSPEMAIIGFNTDWTTQTPDVFIVNVNNAAEVYTASQVSVSSDINLTAIIDIPFSATVGMYNLVAGDVSLPAAFEVTVVNALSDIAEATMKVYPNPAVSAFVTIETTKDSEVFVYDLSGNTLLSQQMTAGNAQLDISTLSSGMYVIENRTAQGRTTQKLVVR